MLTGYKGNYKVDTAVKFCLADGTPASLVALVAPHGKGKSSVVEGVELALTETVMDGDGSRVAVTALGGRGAFGETPVHVHVQGVGGHRAAVVSSRKLTAEGSGIYADAAVAASCAVYQALDERMLGGKLKNSASELAAAFTRLFGSAQARLATDATTLDEAKLDSEFGALNPALSGTFQKVAKAAYSELINEGGASAAPTDSEILERMGQICARSQETAAAAVRKLRGVIDAQAKALEMLTKHGTVGMQSPEVLPQLRADLEAARAWENALAAELARTPGVDAGSYVSLAQAELTSRTAEVETLKSDLQTARDELTKTQNEIETRRRELEAIGEKLILELGVVEDRMNNDARIAEAREKLAKVKRVSDLTAACVLVAESMSQYAADGSPAATKCPLTGRTTDPAEWTKALERNAARAEKATAATEAARSMWLEVQAQYQNEIDGLSARLADEAHKPLQALATQEAAKTQALETRISGLESSLGSANRRVDAANRTLESRKAFMARKPRGYKPSESLVEEVRLLEAFDLVRRDSASDKLEIDRLTLQQARTKDIQTFCTAASKGILARMETQIVDRLSAFAQKTRPVDAQDFVVAVERGTQGLVFGARLRNPSIT
ncbi:MAG: hypothetical protein EBR88_05760, partial [Betaproteobacteria bacterium]|nr:hypothetical protein [Betaproteobacteria bacterium]